MPYSSPAVRFSMPVFRLKQQQQTTHNKKSQPCAFSKLVFQSIYPNLRSSSQNRTIASQLLTMSTAESIAKAATLMAPVRAVSGGTRMEQVLAKMNADLCDFLIKVRTALMHYPCLGCFDGISSALLTATFLVLSCHCSMSTQKPPKRSISLSWCCSSTSR